MISDFGGVLTTPLGNAFAAWSKESGVPLEDLGAAMAKATEDHDGQHPLFLLERGELTEREFLDRLQAAMPGGHDLEGMFDVWFGYLERNPEMIELMRDLRGRGLRMALLTNNVREWEPRWRPMLPELDEIFEVVVDSGFVGMRKPEPGIYELTLERLGGVAGVRVPVRGRHGAQLRRRPRAGHDRGAVPRHRAGARARSKRYWRSPLRWPRVGL